MSKFKKTKEDFVCENCGTEVKGDGFTNHCPKCLYSKHVDIFPGDRALLRQSSAGQACEGMMKPISAEQSGGEWSIIHRCLKCSKEQKNKISKDDNFDEIVKISANKLA
jgi:Zn finger protein HypA/HybF involved in hydrogenase expression